MLIARATIIITIIYFLIPKSASQSSLELLSVLSKYIYIEELPFRMPFQGSSFLTRFQYYSTSSRSFLSTTRHSFALARRSIQSLIYTRAFLGNIQQQYTIRQLLLLQTLQVGLQSLLQRFQPFSALLQGFGEYERIYIEEYKQVYTYYNLLLERSKALSLLSPLSLLVLLEVNIRNTPLITFLPSSRKIFYISTLRSSNTFFYYSSLYPIFSL